MANTIERLRALYSAAGSLTVPFPPGGGTVATMRVPYHEVAQEADVA